MRTALAIIFVLAMQQYTVPSHTGAVSNGGGSPTWTEVARTFCSSVTGTNCSGGTALSPTATSGTLVATSTTTGDKAILWMACGNTSNQRTISTITTGETMTLAGSTSRAFNTGAGAIDAAYILSEAGAKTTFDVTLSGACANYFAISYTEYSSTNTASFDSCNATTNGGTSSTSQNTPTLSPSGTNDVFDQFSLPDQTDTAISGSEYSGNTDFTDGLGRAFALTQASYTQRAWTVSPAGGVANGVCSLKQ